ncbi:hypothetical protein J1N35_044108 [Gossypium stocksii]|uniref:Uncharacterized protein n=1 Tax=Gossypium stocksii TaxID=47602 RepID=A0A9D3U8R9_9ROSI|nr:hypothetical protein J1N35_044108 [Gossypium stocksii]
MDVFLICFNDNHIFTTQLTMHYCTTDHRHTWSVFCFRKYIFWGINIYRILQPHVDVDADPHVKTDAGVYTTTNEDTNADARAIVDADVDTQVDAHIP